MKKENQAPEAVHKVTLSSGKVVLVREMKIKYQDLAMKAVGKKADDNQMLFASLMQKELMKILILQIEGKTIDKAEIENLDDLFSFQEYTQMSQFMNQVMGGGSLGEFQTEIVLTGSK